jgi:pyruvate carboxylase subunit B
LDILEPGIPKATKILEENKLPVNDENLFIIASCEQKGLDFLLGNGKINVRKKSDEEKAPAKPAAKAAALTAQALGPRAYSITVNNRIYDVTVAEGTGAVQATPAATPAAAPAAPVTGGTEVDAPTPGNIVKILVKQGDSVTKDQPLLVMEAMKMESEVKSPCGGTIQAIHISAGDTVQASDPLFTIG